MKQWEFALGVPVDMVCCQRERELDSGFTKHDITLSEPGASDQDPMPHPLDFPSRPWLSEVRRKAFGVASK
jgi:hypothetical protein